MKKIGILFGQENSFPAAFVEEINKRAVKNISAEFVRIDKVMQAEPLDYAVIVDRISQDVPFYRAMLKNAAICGTAKTVIEAGNAARAAGSRFSRLNTSSRGCAPAAAGISAANARHSAASHTSCCFGSAPFNRLRCHCGAQAGRCARISA